LPGNWILGQVSGIAVDRNDHIWIVHRPATLLDDEKGATKNLPETKCCTAPPPVLEFDQEGNLLRYWGGPGVGYDWPKSEHGIHVDSQGNVWLAGNDNADHQILTFTGDGKFLQQIGKANVTGDSNSQDKLGRPAMARTVRSSQSTGTMGRCSPNGGVMAASPASSNGCTTLPSTPKETSTRRKSALGTARKSFAGSSEMELRWNALRIVLT
jgi:hypothetical protein